MKVTKNTPSKSFLEYKRVFSVSGGSSGHKTQKHVSNIKYTTINRNRLHTCLVIYSMVIVLNAN
jgi:hypothetical protein